MKDFILDIILTLPAIIIAFTVHEYAHAKVAYKLGDMTPKFQGRVTLNPSSHIDPLGLICIMLCGFGWGKSVQTNPSAYKNYYKDDLKVSIAGPLANLVVAIIGAIVFMAFTIFLVDKIPYSSAIVAHNMLRAVVIINVNIFVLNMLPIPGFDGFHVLKDLAPAKFYKWAEPLYQYQMLIMLGVIMLGQYIIGIPSMLITSGIMTVVKFIFGIFI